MDEVFACQRWWSLLFASEKAAGGVAGGVASHALTGMLQDLDSRRAILEDTTTAADRPAPTEYMDGLTRKYLGRLAATLPKPAQPIPHVAGPLPSLDEVLALPSVAANLKPEEPSRKRKLHKAPQAPTTTSNAAPQRPPAAAAAADTSRPLKRSRVAAAEEAAPSHGRRERTSAQPGSGSLFQRSSRRGARNAEPEPEDNFRSYSRKERAVASFVTAGQQLALDSSKQQQKGRSFRGAPAPQAAAAAAVPDREGGSRGAANPPRRPGLSRPQGPRKVSAGFVPPTRQNEEGGDAAAGGEAASPLGELNMPEDGGLDEKVLKRIESEVLVRNPNVQFDDIAGLKFAKSTVVEMCIWPLQRPDLFHGLRSMGGGVLLFGPPGTGKTLIGKMIATTCEATFFSISASSLTSKWVGEGERMVRALFAVAHANTPAVIFIDEIDSLLSQRSESEHESSRRIKTEFLVQLDGAGTAKDVRLLVVGATNRPQELDEAARRRLVKRIYIPLPDPEARTQIVRRLLQTQRHKLEEPDMAKICTRAAGYSGADMTNLCKEAAMYPMRDVRDIANIKEEDLRPMAMCDFDKAFRTIRASVSPNEVKQYEDWNRQFGSAGDGDSQA